MLAIENILERIEALHPSILANIESKIWDAIGKYLKESENKLIDLMDGKHPTDDEKGTIELGLMLYWIDTHLPEIGAKIPEKTSITQEILDQWQETLEGPGVPSSDGTLIGYSKYMQLDPGWFEAAFYYLYYLAEPEKVHNFVKQEGPPVNFTGDSLTIAVIGDWGTGQWQDGNDADGPGQEILAQAVALNPDLIIHLGDVYYVGTSSDSLNQEVENFASLWKPGSQGTFTLNSNHEMYDGANGYFDNALPYKDVNGNQLFRAQNGASYFALTYNDWVILGLDSAYDANFPDNTLVPFFMEGRITDSDQLDYIASLDLTGKQVVVMTHHTGMAVPGMDSSGKGKYQLWDDVNAALGGNDPDYWYWGHVHNGIVYTADAVHGSKTKARCVGHGAIPFGSAYGLTDAPVSYFANTPYPNPTLQQEARVLNGFALLTFNGDTLTEAFYEQGNPDPVYTVPQS